MEATTTHKNLYALHVQSWKNITETNQLICQAYGKNAAGIPTIKKWFKKFIKCDFDLNVKTSYRRSKETKDFELYELLDKDNSIYTWSCKVHAGQSIDNPKKAKDHGQNLCNILCQIKPLRMKKRSGNVSISSSHPRKNIFL